VSDLYIDPTSRDLVISETGQVRLTDGVPEAAAQRIAISLLMFTGEWFLDLAAGVPYYEEVLIKNPDLDLIRALFRRKVAEDAYVVDVPRCEVTFNNATRALTVEFDARLREGSELQILIEEGIVNGALVVNSVVVVVNGTTVVVNG
jgi:hypothetical protein